MANRYMPFKWSDSPAINLTLRRGALPKPVQHAMMAKLTEVLMWWEKVPDTPTARKLMKGWVYEVAEDADYNAGSPDRAPRLGDDQRAQGRGLGHRRPHRLASRLHQRPRRGGRLQGVNQSDGRILQLAPTRAMDEFSSSSRSLDL